MKILDSFVASPFAGAIGWTLLHSLWEGAAISALLASVLLATRSARLRYAAACVAMIAMVVAFAVTIYRLIPESAQNFARFRTMVLFVAPNVAIQADRGRTWSAILSALAPWLTPFWIGGVLLLSLERVMSCVAVRRLRSRGVCFASEERHAELAHLAAQLRVSRPVHLLESCFAEIPMVLGHLRPVILVPLGLLANLPSEQVETILLHELVHIRRCDYLVNVLQRIVESVLFYHPAVWWISKVMRTERENCCDDVVVSVSQHADEYALALAALERSRLRQQAAVAATGGNLVKRIRRLLYPKAPAGIWAPLAATAIFVVTAAVSFAAWQPKTAQLAVDAVGTQSQASLESSGKATVLRAQAKAASPEQDPLDATNVTPKDGPQLKPLSSSPITVRLTGESAMVYQTIASLAGLNIQFDPAFKSRRIDISLANVSVEQALDAVSLKTSNTWQAIASNTFIVSPGDVNVSQSDETTIEKTFYLSHQIGPDEGDQIAARVYMDLGDGTGIQYVAAQNAIIVRDTPENLVLAGKIIDVEENQIVMDESPVDPGGSRRLRLQVRTLENLLQQNRSAEAQELRNAVVEENGDPAQRVQGGEVTIATPFDKWLNEDVVYIITDEERDTFLHLNSDEEREQFMRAFWERRNPTPGSADNEFKDENDRRIAYSNEHFGTPSGKGGWQTDRGHIYIVCGSPDVRDHFLAGENGNQFASERWHYNHIEGVGDNLMFEFVDRGGSGDFVLVPSPSNGQGAPKPGASNAGTEPDENASRGVAILSPTEGVNFAPYIREMLKSVQAHWYKAMPQEAIQGQAAGQVSVIFSIQPDGRLGEEQVDSSSGVRSFDAAAINSIHDSSPLQPLPKEFRGSYLRLKITFAYNRPLHS